MLKFYFYDEHHSSQLLTTYLNNRSYKRNDRSGFIMDS